MCFSSAPSGGNSFETIPSPAFVRAGQDVQSQKFCPVEFHALLAEVQQEPYRVMVILAGCLGLSRSELTGLQWSDFDWERATLTIRRGMVNNHVGNPKTLARRKPVPLAPELITILEECRRRLPTHLIRIGCSRLRTTAGGVPYWPDSALKRIIQPAANGLACPRPWVAHVPALVFLPATGEPHGCEGAAGTLAAFQHRHDYERLHASCE